MRNTLLAIKNNILLRYKLEDENSSQTKSTNINVLLNRVRLGKKKESRKKIIFTVATSLSVALFSVLIF